MFNVGHAQAKSFIPSASLVQQTSLQEFRIVSYEEGSRFNELKNISVNLLPKIPNAGSIALPSLSFSMQDCINYINYRMEQNNAVHPQILMYGGGALHSLIGLEAADVDLYFLINKEQLYSISNFLNEYIVNHLHQYLQEADADYISIVKNFYLHESITRKSDEGDSGFKWFRLGQHELKFHYGPPPSFPSDAESWAIDWKTGQIYFLQRSNPEEAFENLKNRSLIYSNPQNVQKLYFRLLLKRCQGFSTSPNDANLIAANQMVLDNPSLEDLRKEIKNHFTPRRLNGAWTFSFLLNALTLLENTNSAQAVTVKERLKTVLKEIQPSLEEPLKSAAKLIASSTSSETSKLIQSLFMLEATCKKSYFSRGRENLQNGRRGESLVLSNHPTSPNIALSFSMVESYTQILTILDANEKKGGDKQSDYNELIHNLFPHFSKEEGLFDQFLNQVEKFLIENAASEPSLNLRMNKDRELLLFYQNIAHIREPLSIQSAGSYTKLIIKLISSSSFPENHHLFFRLLTLMSMQKPSDNEALISIAKNHLTRLLHNISFEQFNHLYPPFFQKLLDSNTKNAHLIACFLFSEITQINREFSRSFFPQLPKLIDQNKQFAIRNKEILHKPLESFIDEDDFVAFLPASSLNTIVNTQFFSVSKSYARIKIYSKLAGEIAKKEGAGFSLEQLRSFNQKFITFYVSSSSALNEKDKKSLLFAKITFSLFSNSVNRFRDLLEEFSALSLQEAEILHKPMLKKTGKMLNSMGNIPIDGLISLLLSCEDGGFEPTLKLFETLPPIRDARFIDEGIAPFLERGCSIERDIENITAPLIWLLENTLFQAACMSVPFRKILIKMIEEKKLETLSPDQKRSSAECLISWIYSHPKKADIKDLLVLEKEWGDVLDPAKVAISKYRIFCHGQQDFKIEEFYNLVKQHPPLTKEQIEKTQLTDSLDNVLSYVSHQKPLSEKEVLYFEEVASQFYFLPHAYLLLNRIRAVATDKKEIIASYQKHLLSQSNQERSVLTKLQEIFIWANEKETTRHHLKKELLKEEMKPLIEKVLLSDDFYIEWSKNFELYRFILHLLSDNNQNELIVKSLHCAAANNVRLDQKQKDLLFSTCSHFLSQNIEKAKTDDSPKSEEENSKRDEAKKNAYSIFSSMEKMTLFPPKERVSFCLKLITLSLDDRPSEENKRKAAHLNDTLKKALVDLKSSTTMSTNAKKEIFHAAKKIYKSTNQDYNEAALTLLNHLEPMSEYWQEVLLLFSKSPLSEVMRSGLVLHVSSWIQSFDEVKKIDGKTTEELSQLFRPIVSSLETTALNESKESLLLIETCLKPPFLKLFSEDPKNIISLLKNLSHFSSLNGPVLAWRIFLEIRESLPKDEEKKLSLFIAEKISENPTTEGINFLTTLYQEEMNPTILMHLFNSLKKTDKDTLIPTIFMAIQNIPKDSSTLNSPVFSTILKYFAETKFQTEDQIKCVGFVAIAYIAGVRNIESSKQKEINVYLAQMLLSSLKIEDKKDTSSYLSAFFELLRKPMNDKDAIINKFLSIILQTPMLYNSHFQSLFVKPNNLIDIKNHQNRALISQMIQKISRKRPVETKQIQFVQFLFLNMLKKTQNLNEIECLIDLIKALMESSGDEWDFDGITQLLALTLNEQELVKSKCFHLLFEIVSTPIPQSKKLNTSYFYYRMIILNFLFQPIYIEKPHSFLDLVEKNSFPIFNMLSSRKNEIKKKFDIETPGVSIEIMSEVEISRLVTDFWVSVKDRLLAQRKPNAVKIREIEQKHLQFEINNLYLPQEKIVEIQSRFIILQRLYNLGKKEELAQCLNLYELLFEQFKDGPINKVTETAIDFSSIISSLASLAPLNGSLEIKQDFINRLCSINEKYLNSWDPKYRILQELTLRNSGFFKDTKLDLSKYNLSRPAESFMQYYGQFYLES